MKWTAAWQIEDWGRSCLCGTAGCAVVTLPSARRLLYDGHLYSRNQDLADVDGQLKRVVEFEAARVIDYRKIVR